MGPQLFGPESDLVPVTLQFANVNGDRKPDMIMRFQGTRIVFLNDQGDFRPIKPNEQGQLSNGCDDMVNKALGPGFLDAYKLGIT